MRPILSAVLLCLLPAVGRGQSVKLPAEVKGDPGTIVIVTADTDCPELQWVVIDPGLSLIPPSLLKDSKSAVVMSGRAGRYRLLAYGALKDRASAPVICTVVIGEAPPPGPNPPGPNPPGPNPPPAPVASLRVLILYESSELSKMPAAQQQVIYGKPIRDYLDAKTPLGPDGKVHEWRIWDANVDASAEHKAWQAMLARPRQSVPWLIAADANGTPVFEGPLPANTQATIDLLSKYAPRQKRKAG